MSTERHTPRTKPRLDAAQTAAQQSSAQAMAGHHESETERRQTALDNQGAQGRGTQGRKHPALSMRDDEDDDTATRH